jgi:hypothetical protein
MAWIIISTGDNDMAANAPHIMTSEEKKVIFASSLGTVFEWYDFYLYGSLAAIIAKQFFSGLDPFSCFYFCVARFRGRLLGSTLWCFGLWPTWGHDWSQVHLLGHHFDHGYVHFRGGCVAWLLQHWCGRTGDFDHPQDASRFGLRG